jgi:hypothetical protein
MKKIIKILKRIVSLVYFYNILLSVDLSQQIIYKNKIKNSMKLPH